MVPVGTGDHYSGLPTTNRALGRTLVEGARTGAAVVPEVLARTMAEGEHEMQLASIVKTLWPRREVSTAERRAAQRKIRGGFLAQ